MLDACSSASITRAVETVAAEFEEKDEKGK